MKFENKGKWMRQILESQYIDSAEYFVPGFKLPLSLDWLINNTKNWYTATNDLKIDKKFKIFAKILLDGDWLKIEFICKDYKDFQFSRKLDTLLVKQMIATSAFAQAIKAWDKNCKANGELIKYFTNAENYKTYDYNMTIASAALRTKKDDSTIIKDAYIKIDKRNFENSDIKKYIEPAVKKTHKALNDNDYIKEIVEYLSNNIKNGKISKMVIKPDLTYFYVYVGSSIYDANDMNILMK